MDKLKHKLRLLSKELTYISDILIYQDDSKLDLKDWTIAYSKILQELLKVYKEVKIDTNLIKEETFK